MNTFTYLLEANINLMLVIGLYKLAFERLTFFQWNRFFLVGGMILGLLIPFVSLPTTYWPSTDFQPVRQVLTKTVTVSKYVSQPFSLSTTVNLPAMLNIMYWLVVSYGLVKVGLDIFAVLRLTRRGHSYRYGSMRIKWVSLPIPTSSFFRYIFLNKDVLQGQAVRVAIQHEQVHSQQWHTLDWLLIRLVSALFWFNPVMRYWRKAITLNHEYTADSCIVKRVDTTRYAHLLVSLASQPSPVSMLHYFSYGQLKSRIIMIHQLPSRATQRLRFLLAAPLVGAMITLVSCEKTSPGDLVSPLASQNGVYLGKDLAGTWSQANQVTVNNNDGKTPRVFPHRTNGLRACSSKLVLGADGRFQMVDEQSGQVIGGTWQSDKAGASVRLQFSESASASSTVHLEVTSLKAGRMQALQAYTSDDHLSGGSVFYEYVKQ